MKAIKIKSDRIVVETEFCGVTVVTRYEDVNGVYFLNEKLEKQYVVIEKEDIVKSIIIEEEGTVDEYRFAVCYAVSNGEGWRNKDTKVNAKSREEAVAKVYHNFKTIYEIEEI